MRGIFITHMLELFLLSFQNQTKDLEDQWTSEKVGATLEMEQAKLELNHATDAGVIATYEGREREASCLFLDYVQKV